MKILHILEDFSLNSGGLRTVVKELNQKLNRNGFESYILSSDCENDDDIYIVNSKNNPWCYSNKWFQTINKIYKEKEIDIFHIHGVWMFPQYISAKFASKYNVPFVISTHGMYKPWLWTKGKTKKKLYFKYLSKPFFSKAKTIHAITNSEKQDLEKLFNNNIVEIPNLIDTFNFKKKKSDEKYILYLGRLDKIKGIDLLITAFSKLNPSNFKLKIAGGINDYKTKLDALIEKNNIQDKVEFLGLVKDDFKNNLFANAHVFVAPSYSEVVGMVNLEAAVLKTPVITTHQTGLKKEWSENGGVLINPTEEELIKALKRVLKWDEEERNAAGKKLFNFVVENYSWEYRFNDWKKLYSNLLK